VRAKSSQPNWSESKVLMIVLLLCVVAFNALADDPPMFARKPKELYDIVGNPAHDQAEQSEAFGVLESRTRGYDSSDPEAEYYLAECYVTGKTGKGGPALVGNKKGFSPNRSEAYDLALPLYENAARRNHVPSLVKLATIYGEGKYAPKDLNKSLTLLIRAAKLGDKNSSDKLSSVDAEGFPEITDKVQRLVIVNLLASNGFPNAQLELAKALILQDTKEAFDKAKRSLVPLAQNGNDAAAALLTEIKNKESSHREKQEAALREQQLADKKALEEAQRKSELVTLSNQQLADQRAEEEKTAKRNEEIGNLVGGLLGLVFFTTLVLVIIGSILGFQKKIVIYESRKDFNRAGFGLLFLIVSVVATAVAIEFGWLLWIPFSLTILLVFFCGKRCYRANGSFGKAFVALPTKFVLAGLLAFCGLVAGAATLVGVKTGAEGFSAKTEEQKKKKYKEASQMLALGAGATGAYVLLNKLIDRLITESPPLLPKS